VPGTAPLSRLGVGPGVSRLVRWGLAAWSLIGLLILAFVAWRYVLVPIDIIFPPLMLAAVFVYLLNPVVSWFERRGIARIWGTLITYVVFLGLFGLGIRFLLPAIAHQVQGFVQQVPSLLNKVQGFADDLNQRFNLHIDVKEAVKSLGPEGGGGRFISRLFSITIGVIHGLVILVIGLLVAFYLLVDLPKLRHAARAAVPPRNQAEIQSVLAGIGRAVRGYFRGQVLVAGFVGLASAFVLYVVGLPYWALVGGLAGFFNLIPLIGPFLAGGIALFIALTATTGGGLLHLEPGFPLALGASLGLLLVQQIDNHIITPNVIGRTVSLHPVTIMLALLAAGSLLGLTGMLLAVPVVGSVKVVLLHLWDKRRWPPGPPGASSAEDIESPVFHDGVSHGGSEVRVSVR
jgi:predicted PurR-regulated permease PerM